MKYIWMEFSCIRRLRSFWPRIASLAIRYLELSTLDVAENGVLADSSFTFLGRAKQKGVFKHNYAQIQIHPAHK